MAIGSMGPRRVSPSVLAAEELKRQFSQDVEISQAAVLAPPPPNLVVTNGWDSMLRFEADYPTFNRVTLLNAPVNASDGATKSYVDGAIAVAATAFTFHAGSGAAPPTTAQIPAGMAAVWKNTTDASVRLYYNDAGVMKSVTLV